MGGLDNSQHHFLYLPYNIESLLPILGLCNLQSVELFQHQKGRIWQVSLFPHIADGGLADHEVGQPIRHLPELPDCQSKPFNRPVAPHSSWVKHHLLCLFTRQRSGGYHHTMLQIFVRNVVRKKNIFLW